MTASVLSRLADIRRLCAKYGVERLAVFGSAAAGRFEPGQSDVDVLVEFAPMSPVEHADSYFGLLEELEKLFGTAVDLIEPAAIRNPYLQASVDQTKVVLYERA